MKDYTNTSRTADSTAMRLLHSDGLVMICLYAAALVIHTLMAQCVTIFNLTPDEYSVTAIAAYANGFDWSSTVSTGGYYGYFQGLLYTPIFRLTDDPYLRYKLMVILNGAVMSLAPVIIYYLSRKSFGIGKPSSALFAAVCGLYPCYMLLTKFTWNETMCNILPWIFLLLAYKALSCTETVKKQVFSALGGLTLVAAYATHGRMLALLAAGVVLVIVAFFVMKKRIFCFTGFSISIAVAFIGDKLLKSYFQNALWLTGETGSAPANTIEKMTSRLSGIDGDMIADFFKALIGHLFYFISSTWGFGAICMVLIIAGVVFYIKRRCDITDCVKEGKDAPEDYLPANDAVMTIFTLLVMAAVFVVSVAFKGSSNVLTQRSDTLIYGRYTEVFYPIAIFTALLLIYRKKLTLIHSFSALAGAAVINALTVAFIVPVVTNGTRMVSGMILGIAPIRWGEKIKDLPTNDTFLKIIITVMAVLIAFTLAHILLRNRKRLYLIYALPLAGLLIYTNIYCYINYNVNQSRNAAVGAENMDEVLSVLNGSGFDSVCCFGVSKEKYVKGQFLYPEMEFIIADNFSELSALSKTPDLIIADREDNLNLWVEDVCLVGDINRTMHLYACTDEAKLWAEEQGLALYENGIIRYSGKELPSTAAVEKTEKSSVLPPKSAIYTNYTLLYKPGTYYITVTGESLDGDATTLTLTSDKGANKLPYTITGQSADTLRIALTVDAKTQSVRFKISNNNGFPIRVDSLTIEKSEDVSAYSLR